MGFGGIGGMLEGGLLGNISGLVPTINAQANQGNLGIIPKMVAPQAPAGTGIGGGPGGIFGNGLMSSMSPQQLKIALALANMGGSL